MLWFADIISDGTLSYLLFTSSTPVVDSVTEFLGSNITYTLQSRASLLNPSFFSYISHTIYVSDTALPDGLELDPQSGVLSGTAVRAGSFPNITLSLVDIFTLFEHPVAVLSISILPHPSTDSSRPANLAAALTASLISAGVLGAIVVMLVIAVIRSRRELRRKPHDFQAMLGVVPVNGEKRIPKELKREAVKMLELIGQGISFDLSVMSKGTNTDHIIRELWRGEQGDNDGHWPRCRLCRRKEAARADQLGPGKRIAGGSLHGAV